MKQLFLVLMVALALSACSDKFLIKDINAFHPASLSDTIVMPDSSLLEGNKEKTKVVMLGLNSDNDTRAIGGGYNAALTSAYLKSIGDKISIVIDSPSIKGLTNVIQEGGKYEESSREDYAMIGKIIEINSRSNYRETYTKQSNAIAAIGYCDNTTHLSAVIDIYGLPAVKKLATIQYGGTISGQSSPPDAANINATKAKDGDKCAYPVELLGKHIAQAGISGILESQNISKFANTVAPSGYIVEKRSDGKSDIYKTTLGKKQAVEPGTEVAILKLKSPDDLDNYETDLDKFKIAQGVVSDKLQDNSSWIIISDLKSNQDIQKGDIVKIQYRSRIVGPTIELY